MVREDNVKSLPQTTSMAEGVRDEETHLKENAGIKVREINVENLPQTASIAEGGGRRKYTPYHNSRCFS